MVTGHLLSNSVCNHTREQTNRAPASRSQWTPLSIDDVIIKNKSSSMPERKSGNDYYTVFMVMADGSSLNDLNTRENKSSPSLMAAQGAEGGNRSSSASDMSNIPIDEVVTVPNVEVKHAPFQSQPNLRGELTAEQVKELGEKMRKEQAKKYFSLRVRMSVFFCTCCLNKLNLQDKLTCLRTQAGF